jgi:hypothetical protein
MSIYAGPVFDIAKTQFGLVADHLQMPDDERSPLPIPPVRGRAERRVDAPPPAAM